MDLDRALANALPSVRRSSAPTDRITYARDLWPRHHLDVSAGRVAENKPGLIVWPQTTDEVADVVRFCAREGIPLVPFGAGSGVCGGVMPNERVVVLDLKRLGKTRAIDRDRGTIEVEAGALGIRLEEDLAHEGLTLGHFPSSILCSTVGGWVAARSAGQCSGRYGKIEDMTAALECVTGAGEVVNLRRRTRGPDMTPLVVGSEGVLAVVTAATLRVHPAPAGRAFGAFSFPSLEAGWTAMREMFQAGLRPAVSRLYDPFDSFVAKMGAVRRAKGAKAGSSARSGTKKSLVPGAGALALRTLLRAPRMVNDLVDALGGRVLKGSRLVLIFEGPLAECEDDLARASAISTRLGAEDLGGGPAEHWLAHRYGVSYRQAPVFMAGAFSDTMEVAASWSHLGKLYRDVHEALAQHVFVMAHLSHAYPDGCSIYFTFAGSSPTVEEAKAKYDAAWTRALDAAIGAGGTLSHHHGVGRSKAPRLGAELGLGVDIVQAIRGALDPSGILNPGNLLPREAPARRPAPPGPPSPEVDRASMLVHARGSATLAEVEHALRPAGLSLGLDTGALGDTSIDRWLGEGAPGGPDPWSDPVDHLVAGFSARLPSGAELDVRPAPRRAVGPDVLSLFFGTRGATGAIEAAHLRAHGAGRARPLSAALERNPSIDAPEQALIDRVLAAARRV
jgi:alkyldihydroxyacetonephosphate synthase